MAPVPDPRAGRRCGRASASAGFATVRLAAVLLVVLDHCAPLTGHGSTVLPRSLGVDLGALAVRALFTVSGYQVALSWAADPHAGRFLAKRVLRIAPPLVVVLVLSALVLGPLLTTLPVGTYLADERTWRYVLDNAALATRYRLPGVFEGNPYPGAPVNGSLWTLPMEAAGYLLVAVLGVVGGRRHRAVAVLALGLLLAGRVAFAGPAGGTPTLLGVPGDALVSMLTGFALGVVLALHRLPLGAPVVAGLVAIIVAVHPLPGADVLRELAVGCAAVVAAHRLPAVLVPPRALRTAGYGTYLYAFPVQQVLIGAGLTTVAGLAGAALPVAWLLGVASWHLVEAPTQALKHALRAPDGQPQRA